VLAAMSMPQELVDAVDDPELYGGEWPPESIPTWSSCQPGGRDAQPFSPEDEDFRHGLARAATLGLDEERLAAVLAESARSARR
jgi:hypothetical protein